MHRALGLTFLLLSALSAGCLADDEAAQPTNATIPQTAPAPAPAQEGDIVGTVVDPTQVPLGGARVFLLRNDTLSTTVARDGSYTLEDVAAGEHLVRAEATGFVGQTFLVRVKSGQVTLLDIVLEPEPSTEPYHETRELAGLMDCSLVVASADTPFRPACVNFDDNARTVFDLAVAPEPARILIEMVWEAQQPLAEAMHMDAQTLGTGPQDADLGDVEGTSILRLDVPGSVLERHYAEGGKLRLNVTVAPSLGDEEGVALGAAIEQPFTLFVTTFFVEAGPTDFSALGGP